MAAVIRELHKLSEDRKNGLSPHFFVEFLRTRVSEAAANEVQEEISWILSHGGDEPAAQPAEEGEGANGISSSRNRNRNNDIVLLRSGIKFSEGGKSVRIKPSTAEALVARKLHLVTGASVEEDQKQLVEDIEHLEEILASSTTEGVAVETLLQAALGGHVGGIEDEETKAELKSSSGETGDDYLHDVLPEEEIALVTITDRIAQLRMIYEKSKESNDGDHLSALTYVATQLQELEGRVERASNSAFSKYDSGEAPVVANIKDLLQARKRLKDAKIVFDAEALKATGGAVDDVDEKVMAAISADAKVSLAGEAIDESHLNVFEILNAVSKQIPQLSQAILERNLLRLIKGGGSRAASATVRVLAEDMPDICQHISSFAVSRNGKLDDDEKSPSLIRSCVKASMEGVLARMVKKSSAAKEEARFIPGGINAALADARSYTRHCSEHFLASISSAGGGSRDDMNRATRWLKEKSLLLFLSLFRENDRGSATIAFAENDSAAIFFSALATVKQDQSKVPYEQVADFYAMHLC